MKLNLNCDAEYIRSFLSTEEADELLEHLLSYEELTSPLTMELANGEYYEKIMVR